MIPPELTAQIQLMLDGELTVGDLATLEAELLENAESREVFRRMAWLHSDLEVVHAGQKAIANAGIVPIKRIMIRQRKRIGQVALGIAALITLILGLLLFLKNIPEVPLASFRTTPGADFTIIQEDGPDDATQVQELTEGSRLKLRTGRVEASFSSGVRLVIEAPCDLEILAKDRVSISEGAAWFEVPSAAKGFTVETAALTVVDLGTAFGVDAAVDGRHEVHVTRGLVEVTSRFEGGETQTLKEGEARRVDEQGGMLTIEFDAHRFPTMLPATDGLVGRWEFESAPNGLTPDSSGNGHLGRFEGGAEIVRDWKRGQVLRLQDAGAQQGWIDLDSVKPIPNLLPHRGLTLAAWIKRDWRNSPDQIHEFVIGLGQERDHPIATLSVDQGMVNGFIEGDGGSDQVKVTGKPAVMDGVWAHIAITYDRGKNEALTYVNGVAQASPKDISVVGDGELDWSAGVIGRSLRPLRPNEQRYFGGLIDDVRIYDRPLDPKEIAELTK